MPLPAGNRLPLRSERDRLNKEGKTFYTRHFTVISAPTPSVSYRDGTTSTPSSLRGGESDAAIQEKPPVLRLSILLSKKTARLAVNRNLIKRRTATLLEELLTSFPPADYLVIPKRSVQSSPYAELLSDLSSLLPKLT